MYNYDELYELFSSDRILCNVGKKEDESISKYPIIYVNSIEEMRKGMDSIKWENTLNEEGNELNGFCYQTNNEERRKERQRQVRADKEKYIFPLENHIKELLKKNGLPEETYIDVRGDMIVLYQFSFFRDIYTCDLAEAMLDIYKAGHVPCGYKGRFHKGSVLVY